MSTAKATSIVNPAELRKVQHERAAAEASKVLELARRAEQEQQQLHEAFLQRDIGPTAIARFNDAVRKAAERGEHEIMIGQFPATFCSDGGRRINNVDPDWPDSLQGVARRVYDYHMEHLAPLGYTMRAEVLNYPGGIPGDIGIFFRW